MEIILYILSPGTEFIIFIFTVWHDFFSLIVMFLRLTIEAPPLSIVQGKCIYNIFKAKHLETQFVLSCTKPSIDKYQFLF